MWFTTTEESLPSLKKFSSDHLPCCKSIWVACSLWFSGNHGGHSSVFRNTEIQRASRPKLFDFSPKSFQGQQPREFLLPSQSKGASTVSGEPPQFSINQDPDGQIPPHTHLQLFRHMCSGPGSLRGANEGSWPGNKRPCKFQPVQPQWSFRVCAIDSETKGKGDGLQASGSKGWWAWPQQLWGSPEADLK